MVLNRSADDIAGPTEPGLTISPAKATIPMGGQVEYVVTLLDEEGNSKNATSQAAVIVKNPKIANYDLFHNKAVARSPGSTVLEFHVGKYSSTVTLVVEPPKNPKLVKIEPAKVKLGIGTTAYLKLVGEYEDGRKVDLTKSADWNWDLGQEAPVFVYAGTVEGQKEGKTQLRATLPGHAEKRMEVRRGRHRSRQPQIQIAESGDRKAEICGRPGSGFDR